MTIRKAGKLRGVSAPPALRIYVPVPRAIVDLVLGGILGLPPTADGLTYTVRLKHSTAAWRCLAIRIRASAVGRLLRWVRPPLAAATLRVPAPPQLAVSVLVVIGGVATVEAVELR